MKGLQQICADMVDSQNKLQSLYKVRRAQLNGGWFNSRADQLQVELGLQSHKDYIVILGECLRRYPAANDATTMPGAA